VILRENPGVTAILNALPDDVESHVSGPIVKVESGTTRWAFRSAWIGEGFPEDLRKLLASTTLTDPNQAGGERAVLVVTARRFSAGTRQRLADYGLSWADLAGRAYLRAEPGLLVTRMPAHATATKSSSIRWSISAGAVAETILALSSPPETPERAREQPLVAAEIADLVEYSYPQVNKVLQQFESAGYVTKVGTERGGGSRRYLRDPSRLLSDWAGWHRRRPLGTVDLQPLWRGTDRTLRLLGERARGTWATTGWIAADHVAPFSTSIPNVACYVGRESFEKTIDALLADPDIEYASEAGRLTVAPAEPHVLQLTDFRGDFPVVSPVRIYGDLVRIGSRADEAAQHLRETLLGY
jgi:hypothetical protein